MTCKAEGVAAACRTGTAPSPWALVRSAAEGASYYYAALRAGQRAELIPAAKGG